LEIKLIVMGIYKHLVISVFAIIILFGCSKNNYLSKKTSEGRLPKFSELLKEYTYCKCILYSIKDSSIQNDISLSVYQELSNYQIVNTVANKLDSAARIAAGKIKPSQLADYNNKKAVFFECFQFYKSKELKKLINRLAR